MPLLDHFHGPTEVELPWSTMTMAWALALVRWLNQTLPKAEFHALADIRMGSAVEADVAEYHKDDYDPAHGRNGAVATLAEAPPAVFTLPAVFQDEVEVEIRERRAGRPLVGVIELISPSNKDRTREREAFVAKCVTYLSRGVGLVLIDVVTARHANLHNELMLALGGSAPHLLADTPTYISGYRPAHRRATGANELEVWPYPAVVGQPVPAVPLGLRGGPVVLLDLEAIYLDGVRSTGV